MTTVIPLRQGTVGSDSVTAPAHGCQSHKPEWMGRLDRHQRRLVGPWVKCDEPVWFLCWSCGRKQVRRCHTTNAASCRPCGNRHRRRVGLVADSGREAAMLEGGSCWMLTLTAPSGNRHLDKRPGKGGECPCSERWAGAFDMGRWNASAGGYWNRLCQDLRRDTGMDLQYFKGAESQDRGALHFHVLIRVPKGRHGLVDVEELRQLAIAHGFGHEVRLDQVRDNSGAARYVAKYVSKSAADRSSMPWCDLETGEVQTARYRTWSASRRWGLTMSQIKVTQAEWWRDQRAAGSSEAAGGGPGSLDSNADHYTTGSLPGGVEGP